MKRICVLLFALSAANTAHPDPIANAIQGFTSAYRKSLEAQMWENRCSRADALRLYTYCYVTPSGKALWQLRGPEREKWKPIALQEQARLRKQYQRDMEIARKEGELAAKEHKMNRQLCDFWRQQAKTPRSEQKIREYCTD